MVAVPAATPVTIPVTEPTVALAVLLLVHVPPVVTSVNVVVVPVHTFSVPVIGLTDVGVTVTTVVTSQPVVVNW